MGDSGVVMGATYEAGSGALQAPVREGLEDELRRSEAYLAEGQRLSHTGSWAWKLDTGEIYWSLEMFRIYGFEPADGTPAYEAVLGRAHPDDAPGVDRALEEAFRTGTELRLLTRIRVPGAPLKWVETYGHPVRDDDGRLVEFIGTVVDVTERVRAHRRLRRAIRARYEAVLAERTRIARDMHDGLLQDVTGIALQLRALLPHVQTSPDVAAATLGRLLEQTERMGREARAALVGMRASPDPGDVVRAVERTAERAAARGSVALAITVDGPARPLRADACEAAASIVHEAITNVVRHAAARTVQLRLTFGRSRLRLSIRDDGRGMQGAPDEASSHFGLLGMRERAIGVGAALAMRSVPGEGTLVTVVVPYLR